jgi:uncharacterized membrane protein YphA (DoxX/SURF4 family)
LRLTVAFNAVIWGADVFAGPNGGAFTGCIEGLFAIAVGIALLIGLFTPAASTLTVIGYVVMAFSPMLTSEANNHISTSTAIDLAAASFALILLGPGAFSVDARLFGRREIIIPEGRRPPRG